ncbi:MAG: hypothetical protein CFH15_01410 [Alphaproteobacteria bacterium MarineAlpha5_Bin5]|nr:MAG: hypothetical protein CFH15_01410 [Alphaproteobacteria bacterium MarineAlpha5_Bin5]PPR50855.1 MAG: hypothetical protein CFH14_00832 [Alphaproteobacteria bacterium MarineAlpha5_Bin4]
MNFIKVVEKDNMKKTIFIICLLFLFSTSLLSKEEKICDWIITNGDYQKYLDDLPKADFHSAFHVAVGSDGKCVFGWVWNYTRQNMISTRGVQQDTVQGSFNECEKWRKGYGIDGECKPYDIDTEIVWNKPEHKILKLLKIHKKELNKFVGTSFKCPQTKNVGMWDVPCIINSKDPSTLQKIIYIGEEKRNMREPYRVREDKSRRFLFKATPYVFDAYYENGKIFEILIYFEKEKNKSKTKAESLANSYAFIIGQMPNVLLQRLDAAHIYADIKGVSNASAHDRIIKIHKSDPSWKSVEELFMHELVHASLDKPIYGVYKTMNKKRHKNETIEYKKLSWRDWREAVKKDKKNI